VFESGSILITGATNKDHINHSYKFIIQMLYNNYNKILLTNIEEFIKSEEVFIKNWLLKAAIPKVVKTDYHTETYWHTKTIGIPLNLINI
jgi:TATA-box binding protein (TBP) (component of TFIID and TFIIIB)